MEKSTQNKPCGLVGIDDGLVELFNQFFDDIKPTDQTIFLREKFFSFLEIANTLGELSVEIAKFIFYDCLQIPKSKLRIFQPHNDEFIQFSRPYLLKESPKHK